MKIFKTKKQMQKWSKQLKKNSQTICLVPTMGYFHKGHISLMEKGRSMCDELVVSIFVNPAQFGPNEDFDSYPSNIERDLKMAEQAGVTAIFLPTREDIYPENFQTGIELKHLPKFLCGRCRPGHFAGVAVIVTKLFNIVMPDVAVFGKKDYQQLQIIKQMVKDLDFDIKIVAGEIIREEDGLAMSSRNTYLSELQRKSALSLSKSIEIAKKLAEQGEKNPSVILRQLHEFINSFPETSIDYITFCDPETLEDVKEISQPVLLAMAVRVGTTRLIDNAVIHPGR